MGPLLKELLKICRKKIDIKTLFNNAIDLFKEIMIVHENNIFHCDIKCSNIYYGNFNPSDNFNHRKLSFIDFGNSVVLKNNTIIPLTHNNKPRCSRFYASLNVLSGETFFFEMIWNLLCLF